MEAKMTPKTILDDITKHLESGKKVLISSYAKAWRFDKRHISMFKATDKGLYMQRGKAWDCIATASTILVSIRFEA
jgi:hypothetical protein